MAKEKRGQVWVLDTETKGTGAEVVSLEKLQRQKRVHKRSDRVSVIRKDSAPESEAAVAVTEKLPVDAPRPRRFKLVNVISGQLVAEDVGAREIVGLLEAVPSIADVHLYVWQPNEDRWRPLTFREKKAFWRFRSNNDPLSWTDSNRQEHHPNRAGDRRRTSAARLGHFGRVRPRLGRAPRSRPGGNR